MADVCPNAPKKAHPFLARIEKMLEHEKIQYWVMSNGCTAGVFFDAEKGTVLLFKFSVPGHIHWSRATESVTFNEGDWKKFRKWCKDFDYIVRMDFFSPDAYRHKWNSTSLQCKYHIRAMNFSKNQVSLRCAAVLTGDNAPDNTENCEVRYDRTSWHDLQRYFRQIDELFQKTGRDKEMMQIKVKLEDLLF